MVCLCQYSFVHVCVFVCERDIEIKGVQFSTVTQLCPTLCDPTNPVNILVIKNDFKILIW